jgi:hypothetical protein
VRLLADRAFRALTALFETDSKLVLTRWAEGMALSYKFQAECFGVVKCMLLADIRVLFCVVLLFTISFSSSLLNVSFCFLFYLFIS